MVFAVAIGAEWTRRRPLSSDTRPVLLRATAAWTLVGVILYLALPLLAPAVLLLSIAPRLPGA